jgi:hypothetical protein
MRIVRALSQQFPRHFRVMLGVDWNRSLLLYQYGNASIGPDFNPRDFAATLDHTSHSAFNVGFGELVLDIKTVERGIERGGFFDIHSIMRSVLIPSKVEVAWRIVG